MNIKWSSPNINNDDRIYVISKLLSNWYSMGDEVRKLEHGMKELIDRKYCVAVNNGTSALEAMLKVLNIGIGDEVIVPALTYIASATAISNVGAKPVFVDVDKTMTINPTLVKEKITDKTKLIMTVDLAGNPCDYDKLDFNIPIVIDGAQSIGVRYKGKPTLSRGICATTSFHIAKILTTIEGGMVFTDNPNIYKKLKQIRNQGEGDIKFVHDIIGSNYRLSDIHAAFGVNQLKRFDDTISYRMELVKLYEKICEDTNIKYLKIPNHNNFMFIIYSDDRDRLAEYLSEEGIETRKIFPYTIPQQPVYNEVGNYPIAEWFCKHSLSLPLHCSLDNNDIKYVMTKIGRFINE